MSAHETENVGISLSDPISCRLELQRVANGLASLTQEHTQLLEELEVLEEQYELYEATAFNAIKSVDKGYTATQIKALALEAIAGKEETAELRKSVRAKRALLVALDRRLRSLEKRGGFAQSALKDHDSEVRNAGYGG